MGAECEHVTFEHELYFNISQNKHGLNLSRRLGGEMNDGLTCSLSITNRRARSRVYFAILECSDGM